MCSHNCGIVEFFRLAETFLIIECSLYPSPARATPAHVPKRHHIPAVIAAVPVLLRLTFLLLKKTLPGWKLIFICRASKF